MADKFIINNSFSKFYFLGIGGIGMSALARYFHFMGYSVAGYDRTESALTKQLQAEGISVYYEDSIKALPKAYQDPTETLIVRTPAVPQDSVLLQYFFQHGYRILKRAELLGQVTRQKRALCVAGTHGKTTTSTLLAHIMHESKLDTSAFLGGISRNYGTNLLTSNSDYVVVEADEYDRSFHQLTPYMTVITSADPDHLDIYGTPEAYRESFEHYTSLIQQGGVLLIKQGINVTPQLSPSVRQYTYAGRLGKMQRYLHIGERPDFFAKDVRCRNGQITFTFHYPAGELEHVQLGVPAWVNIENAVAAMAIAWLNGVPESVLLNAVATFKGVERRFAMHVQKKTSTGKQISYIDDYAHHPGELQATIRSVRKLYPERHIIGVFQPHLFSRTRDFYKEFAESLSEMDSVILLPIYPAREQPIEGVTSAIILDELTADFRLLCQKEELVETLVSIAQSDKEDLVFLTLGAGDIDRLVPEITKAFEKL